MEARAILFDFDHTLGIDHHLEFEVLRGLADRFCAIVPDDEELRTRLESFRSGKVSLETALISAFTQWQCIDSMLPRIPAEFRAAALAQAPLAVTPMPGAKHMLQTLAKRGMPIAILSNGWQDLQHAKAQIIGFPGPVFSSEELRAWKPAPEAFSKALALLNLDAATTLYVGDQPAVDIAGAKNAGLLAVWANLEDGEYPASEVQPDGVITALAQLLSLA